MIIGFIGLGVMGSRMVKRMKDSGYEVYVYNRTESKLASAIAAGAKPCASIAETASVSDILCTCLSMPQDVEMVYGGEQGLFAHAKKGTICIDFTTVDRDTSIRMEELGRQHGVYYLDAPVSGGPEGVEQGTLTIMVGGEEKIFAQVLPLLQTIGQKIEYLGHSGSGSVAKLLNQYLVAVHSLAASEVMVAGSALGLRAEQLYDILRVSYGDSRMLRRHMENFVLDRQFAPGGAVKYVLKDVRLANEMLLQANVPARTGQSAEAAFEEAKEQGLAELDMSAVIQLLEKEAGIIVKHSKYK
jgi:3-hydroxyisobutyrate dehydrogenase